MLDWEALSTSGISASDTTQSMFHVTSRQDAILSKMLLRSFTINSVTPKIHLGGKERACQYIDV